MLLYEKTNKNVLDTWRFASSLRVYYKEGYLQRVQAAANNSVKELLAVGKHFIELKISYLRIYTHSIKQLHDKRRKLFMYN